MLNNEPPGGWVLFIAMLDVAVNVAMWLSS